MDEFHTKPVQMDTFHTKHPNSSKHHSSVTVPSYETQTLKKKKKNPAERILTLPLQIQTACPKCRTTKQFCLKNLATQICLESISLQSRHQCSTLPSTTFWGIFGCIRRLLHMCCMWACVLTHTTLAHMFDQMGCCCISSDPIQGFVPTGK